MRPCLLTTWIQAVMVAGVVWTAPVAAVQVLDGPILLHANVTGQWGGHTFSYALQGERYLFWTAILNRWEAGPQDEQYPSYVRQKYLTHVVGQFPLPGTDGPPAVHTFTINEEKIGGGPQPLLFRTPDGTLHLLVGVYHYTDNPRWGYGTLRYYRSARPEDVTAWVDRTALIPTQPYGQFHLRMNVAVTPDGQRAVIAILAVSEDGSVPFNTPVIFYGQREGLDFRFAPAVKYQEPMGFFYPQIAALPGGVVLVGEVWDVAERSTSRLVHLDWEGHVLHEEDLPAGPEEGAYLSFDMRPERPGDWEHLVIYHNFSPRKGPWSHQFLTYDVAARQLERRRAIPVEYNVSNAGKWLYVSPERSAFIHNPSMGQCHAWEGNLLGEGPLTFRPLERMNPLELGYLASAYVMVPNPLQGSVVTEGEAYLMSDHFNPDKPPDARGPCSLLLWRLAL